MAQNDFEIANQGFPAFRADLNSALQSLATLSSGATAPIVPFNYQLWYDTANDILKIRNAANDGWIDVFTFDQVTGDVTFPALGVTYDNTSSGLTADTVQAAIDEIKTAIDGLLSKGIFYKTLTRQVAWTKTGNTTATTSTELFVEVDGSVKTIASGTTITMPALSAGTDYAIWCSPAGVLEADASFTVAPTADGRLVGGFHYAPGGNATISATGDWTAHTGGNTTPQINEYSFWDLLWKPSASDPRGLTLVNNSFWTGIYLMSDGGSAPLHRYDVNPCRDGNAPFKPYATTPTRYSNAIPLNISELLMYNGFRMPNIDEFQLLALGTTEQTSLGGSGPGNTGVFTSGAGTKERFTSAWGVMDATGVLLVWGRGGSADQTSGTVSGVSQGRTNDIFRISRFARFGGSWNGGAFSGSRFVAAAASSASGTDVGGRGVCDHLILD